VPSLTDGEIRRALKQVEQTGKQLSLVDGEGHGSLRTNPRVSNLLLETYLPPITA